MTSSNTSEHGMMEHDEPAAEMPQRLLEPVSVEEYCELMSAFPTGVAVVTALDAAGVPCGMTCSSLTSVTLVPPTLLVCLRIGSRTLDAVSSCGAFAVNLLHAKAHRAAELFSRPTPDRFGQVSWRCSGSGLPWLCDDAFALAECRLTRRFEVGDHMVIFGQVSRIVQTEDTPLLHGLRRFASWCPGGLEDGASAASTP
jgi:flavin reductase (DIM6/NTAB) family NADH-FMN oxidoreductase RutF